MTVAVEGSITTVGKASQSIVSIDGQGQLDQFGQVLLKELSSHIFCWQLLLYIGLMQELSSHFFCRQ